MKFILILLSVSLGLSEVAFACTQPTVKELQDFFQSKDHWSQVRNNTNQRIDRNRVEVKINFRRPLSSQIMRGGEVLGQVDHVCRINTNTIRLEASGYNIRISRKGDRIQTRIGLFTYQFLPNGKWIDAMDQDLQYNEDLQYAEGPVATQASL